VDCPWDMEELVAKKNDNVDGDKLTMSMAF
jgi:hypothetical protein